MRFRKTFVSLAAGGLLVAMAGPSRAAIGDGPLIVPFDECSAASFQNDPRLGPAKLPLFGEVGEQVSDYDRTGNEPTRQFLATWWDPSASFSPYPATPGFWMYPPQNGYYLNADGSPIRSALVLAPGQQIDRFGRATGSFLAPQGTDYEDRSLPPTNLNDPGNPGSCNYHVYQVLRGFTVYAGGIRPWFDQPGDGIQYQVVCALIPGSETSQQCDSAGNLQTQYLLDNGYLAEVPVTDNRGI
ncbi:TNT domain-containing protein [Frankia sp. CNm7]|uniref:TNT domain-containing protein n=1 Tax=Frankia nepalensis TaxID=1836974 RepID=A0A937RGI4_9ACTN|nr:TNT domain-containing protein [Frankia nepalensis]MBL7500443.1 TNT domain-containing protein [Frankia nepalensis]MBL7511196.1 TNT domain-containing protein [Frankia nepalensis]MBL7522280.1 TNT domain-containing protein [Frankia nepalensis]MBL7626964.1 TNT domain-containing protein [Frankia nepalensis]